VSKNDFSDFNRLVQSVLSYRSSKALLVALHYDLFTWVERGFDTSHRLSRKLRLDDRALSILLNALVALGYLRKRGSRYGNAPLARKLLVEGAPHYKGNNIRYQEQTWDAWSDLRGVLKTGKPRLPLLGWLHKKTFTPDYIKAMYDISKEPAAELAAKLSWTGVRRSLDVGCGPGTYSAAFVRRHPALDAVLFDLAGTLRVTRECLKNNSDRRRFILRTGNYLRDDFGSREFDLILISHVTHNENPATNRKLVRKAFAALRPGGRLVIHDFILEPQRDSPAFSALFALHLLVFTGAGTTYTLADYDGWMREGGFSRLSHVPIAKGSITPSFAIVGHKS
jgi:SAM-dependent methyltransferase